ncbi:uncharacterized, partial [Tachysurus ichikawai]
MSLSRLSVPANLIILASIERGFARCDKLQSKHPGHRQINMSKAPH